MAPDRHLVARARRARIDAIQLRDDPVVLSFAESTPTH
jgi:hypothetical protein